MDKWKQQLSIGYFVVALLMLFLLQYYFAAPKVETIGYSEFLGYFMPRKVLCGKETIRAAGTVTKKLAKWLSEKGYVKDDEPDQE